MFLAFRVSPGFPRSPLAMNSQTLSLGVSPCLAVFCRWSFTWSTLLACLLVWCLGLPCACAGTRLFSSGVR